MSHLYPWSDLCLGQFVGLCRRRRADRSRAAVPVAGVGGYSEVTGSKKKREDCGLIQEEQVGKDENVKGLECHEEDSRVYFVGHKESSLLKTFDWG